ncbi:hypothetical protein NMG60_11008114 [Bertholletia excelsa]
MSKLIKSTCFFLLVVLLFCVALCTEGRNLKLDEKKVKCIECLKPNVTKYATEKRKEVASATADDQGHMDAFRPTTPGHSPGIGHSIHN